MVSGGEVSVANDLEVEVEDIRDREACRKGGAFKQRNLVTVAAIVYMNSNNAVLRWFELNKTFGVDDAWK